MHKDDFLTPGESRARPPPLDWQSALFLDVDGTLLEIAPRPELVHVPEELPVLLSRLSAQRQGALALVSGRSLAQIDLLFKPWLGAAAGLHGIERRRADGSFDNISDKAAAAALGRIRPRLAALAAEGSGLIIEDEGSNLTLHYRSAPEREREIHAFAEARHREAGPALRLIKGKMVVEFQPAGIDKGRVIAAFLAEPPFRGRPAVFVGDDTTDEDGFVEIRRRGGIAVRVGPPGRSAAGHALPSVSSVLDWLARTGLP